MTEGLLLVSSFLVVFLRFFFRVFFHVISGENGNGALREHCGENSCEQRAHVDFLLSWFIETTCDRDAAMAYYLPGEFRVDTLCFTRGGLLVLAGSRLSTNRISSLK